VGERLRTRKRRKEKRAHQKSEGHLYD
jgi:hypothetical protein